MNLDRGVLDRSRMLGALCVCSIIMLWLPRPAFGVPRATMTDLPAHLGLGDAIALFRQRGFDLLIADAGIESARADELTAGAVPNPSTGVTVGKTFFYNPRFTDC